MAARSAANWRNPSKWNRQAFESGVSYRVFCASLADVFDNQVPKIWRRELWDEIGRTPCLDWLLLTKRPQNIHKMLPAYWGDGWPNVWLGTTAENQDELERRVERLLCIPARVHFVSCEPLLGPLDFMMDTEIGPLSFLKRHNIMNDEPTNRLDWVIVGGESGPKARYMEPAWAASIRDQCKEAGIAFFLKQMTKKAPIPEDLMVREFPR